MNYLGLIQNYANENFICATGMMILEELQSGHQMQMPLEKFIEFPSSSKVWDKNIRKLLGYRNKRQENLLGARLGPGERGPDHAN